MEVYELRDGLYRLFDSTGRIARLGEKKWDVIAEDWSQPEPDELRVALSAYLAALIIETLEEEQRPRWIKAISRATARLLGRERPVV